MKKEEKIRILNSSAALLKESAEMLGKAINADYEDFTEKDFLERISISLNAHFLIFIGTHFSFIFVSFIPFEHISENI